MKRKLYTKEWGHEIVKHMFFRGTESSANELVEFYEEVEGELDKTKVLYEWDVDREGRVVPDTVRANIRGYVWKKGDMAYVSKRHDGYVSCKTLEERESGKYLFTNNYTKLFRCVTEIKDHIKFDGTEENAREVARFLVKNTNVKSFKKDIKIGYHWGNGEYSYHITAIVCRRRWNPEGWRKVVKKGDWVLSENRKEDPIIIEEYAINDYILV